MVPGGTDGTPDAQQGSAPRSASRVDEAIARYLEEASAGRRPEPQDFIRRNPAVAAELEEFFRDEHGFLARLRSLSPSGSRPSWMKERSPLDGARVFGDYDLVEEIARGGMGAVYKAFDRRLERTVALKVILGGVLASPADLRRFHTEARAAARLEHSHIVPIHEVGEVGGQAYYTMKLLDGGSLAQRLANCASDLRGVAAMLEKVARAVHGAHQRGVLHRDLKPSNILFDAAGEPHVADFGLAKVLDADGTVTRTGAAVGTPAYMAPEQARGERERLSACTDVYALGVVLYELLAKRLPFAGGSSVEVLRRVVEEEPAPPRRWNPKAPRDLETVALKCLEKDPARRYATAEGLAEDLRRWLQGEPILARRASSAGRVVKWAKRRPSSAALVATLATLLLAAALGGIWYAAARRHEAEVAAEYERHDRYSRLLFIACDRVKAGILDTAKALLEETRPKLGEEDLRGVEWDLLAWKVHGGCRQLLSIPGLSQGGAPHRAAVFIPGTRTVVAAHADGWIRRWDPESGESTEVFRIEGAWANSLTPSPDGRTLVWREAERFLLRAFDMASGRTLWSLPPERFVRLPVTLLDVAFSADGGRILLVVFADGRSSVHYVDPRTGEAQKVHEHGGLGGAVLSPDLKTLAVAEDDSLTSYDALDMRLRLRIPGRFGWCAFSPCGRSLAAMERDPMQRRMHLFDAKDGRSISPPLTFPAWLELPAFTSDGSVLAIPARDQRVRFHDLFLPRPLGAVFVDHLKGDSGVGFNSDSSLFLVASTDRVATVWKFVGPGMAQEKQGFRYAETVWEAAFSPDGKSFACAGDDDVVHVYRIRDGTTLEPAAELRLAAPGAYEFNCLSPDAERLAVARKDGAFEVWKVPRPGQAAPLAPERALSVDGTKLYRGGFSADSTLLAASTEDNDCVLWRRRDVGGRTEWSLEDRFRLRGRASRFVFSPDPRLLALVTWEPSQLILRDLERRRFGTLSLGQLTVLSVAFSPDARLLALGQNTGRVLVFEREPGEATMPAEASWDFDAHPGVVRDVTFSPDGRRLLTGGEDAQVRIWDLVHGPRGGAALLCAAVGFDEGRVTGIVFSPDATLLAVQSGNLQTPAFGGVWVSQIGGEGEPPAAGAAAAR